MNEDGENVVREGSAAYEALCRRCGVCCHHKVRFGDQVVITDIPCRFLDTESKTCTVYERRYAEQPLCSSAAASLEAGALPGDCPYVGGRDGYRTPLLLSEHPEYEQAVNALFPERKKAHGGRSAIKAARHRRHSR